MFPLHVYMGVCGYVALFESWKNLNEHLKVVVFNTGRDTRMFDAEAFGIAKFSPLFSFEIFYGTSLNLAHYCRAYVISFGI